MIIGLQPYFEEDNNDDSSESLLKRIIHNGSYDVKDKTTSSDFELMIKREPKYGFKPCKTKELLTGEIINESLPAGGVDKYNYQYNSIQYYGDNKLRAAVYLNLMSFQDINEYLKSRNDIYSQNITARDAILQGAYGKNGELNYSIDIHNLNVFANAKRYQKTLKAYDDFINELNGKEETNNESNPYNYTFEYTDLCNRFDINFNLELKQMELVDNVVRLKDNKTYKYNSKEVKDLNYTHNVSTIWKEISVLKSNSEEDKREFEARCNYQNIETISNWITSEAKCIFNPDEINEEDVSGENIANTDPYVHAKIYTLLTGEIRDYLENNGLNCEEFLILYNIFKYAQKEIRTYQPYIEKVTNHWYKDLKFEMGSTYELSSIVKTVDYQYKPEGRAQDDRINKLAGTIWCEMAPTEGQSAIVQKGDPKIIKNEPWHYKVKNWLVYGYYFIYDGTVKTAEEIDSAKILLSLRGYSSENPLLIDINDNEQEDLYINGARKSEIDNKAKEYNEALKRAGKNVRLQRINFEKKSSLTAFSILEGMHTEDSEYIYRDLKEYLIELGYFTRADFESVETGNLKWLIPSYTVYKGEWPSTEYEKNATEYGSYIRSKASLTSQRQNTYKENLEGADTSPTGSSNNIDSNHWKDTSYVDYWDDKEYNGTKGGYVTTSRVNGITYRNYKQTASAYDQKPFSAETMHWSGCGPTSCAILLSGYGIETGPWTLAQRITEMYNNGVLQGPTGSPALIEALKTEQIVTEHENVGAVGIQQAVSDIRKTLRDGRPVLLGTDLYGNDGHWVCAIGITNNDQDIIISDPFGEYNIENSDNYEIATADTCVVPYIRNLETFVTNHMSGATYIMPTKQPTGLKSTSTRHEVIGFKPGLKVVMPETGTIIKMGNVNDENNNADNLESNSNGTGAAQENSNNSNNPDISNTSDNSNASDNPSNEESKDDEEEPSYDERVRKANEYFTTNGNYIIVKFETGNGMNGWKMRIEGADFKNLEVGSRKYNKGEEIGLTTTENMKVVLFDEKGAIVDNIEDYFKLASRKAASGDDFEKFFFVVYEGGEFDKNGPAQVGPLHNNEFGVGICQWTVIGNNDYLSGFLKGLYAKDSSFCGALKPFLNYTAAQYLEHFEDLKEAFADMAEIDKEYLLQLEMEYAIKEKSDYARQLGYSWILDRPSAVVGTAFSMINLGPGHFVDCMNDKGINESMSDEEIIMNICAFMYEMHPADLNLPRDAYVPRAESQARFAMDLLEGKINDVEKFVRSGFKGDNLKYAQGKNSGFLKDYV